MGRRGSSSSNSGEVVGEKNQRNKYKWTLRTPKQRWLKGDFMPSIELRVGTRNLCKLIKIDSGLIAIKLAIENGNLFIFDKKGVKIDI